MDKAFIIPVKLFDKLISMEKRISYLAAEIFLESIKQKKKYFASDIKSYLTYL